MNNFFIKLLLIFLITLTQLFASQKQADEIAQISSSYLYNINKKALQKTIKTFLPNIPNLKALKIVENLTSETYVSVYKNEKKNTFSSMDFTKEIGKYKLYKANSNYENEVVGEVFAYFDETKSTTLNEKEISWIKTNPIINIAIVKNYKPYDMVGENNKLFGFHSDIIKLINKKLSTNVKLTPFNSWNDAYTSASSGKVNGIFSLSWSLEREKKYFDYSPTYHFTPYHLLVKKDNQDITTLESLKTKKIAIEKKTIFTQVVEEKVPSAKIILVNNTDATFKSVSIGETAATISASLDEAILEKYNLKIASEFYHKSSELYIGVNKKFPTVSSILKKGLNAISLKEMANLRNKWFNDYLNKSSKKTTITKELNFTQKEQKWINKNPIIKIAFMNYWLKDENGDNIHSDLLKLLNQYSNLHFVPIKYDSWKNGYDDAISGEVLHGILNLSWSKEREEKNFNYTNPYNLTPSKLIVRKTNTSIKNIKDLKGKTVYLRESSITYKTIKEQAPTAKIINLKNENILYEKLSLTDEADAILDYSFDERTIKKNKLKVVQNVYDKYSEVALGISKKYPELYLIIEKIYKKIPKNEFLKLQKKDYSKKKLDKPKKIILTKDEINWLKKHKDIKIAIMNNWEPLNYVDEKGKPKGLGVDFINVINKKLGGVLKIYPDNFSNNLEKLKTKKIDAMLDITPTQKRMEFYHFTEPYITIPKTIITRKDSKIYYKNETMLNNKRVAIEKGYITAKDLKKVAPDIKIIDYANTTDSLDALSKGLVDAYVGNKAVAQYIIERDFIGNLKFHAKTNINGSILAIGVRKDWEILRDILQKSLDAITIKERKEIIQNYIQNTNIDTNTNIKLTKIEKLWVQTHTVKVGVNTWAPFILTNTGKDIDGISGDILKLIIKRTGLKVEYKNDLWASHLANFKNKKIDLLPVVYYTKERSTYGLYTDGYFKMLDSIYVKNDNVEITSMSDLNGRTLALQKGFAAITKIKEKFPKIKILESRDVYDSIIKVLTGEADALYDGQIAVERKLQEELITGLKGIPQNNFKADELRLFSRIDEPILQTILQKALKSITVQEKREIFSRWLDINNKIAFTNIEQKWLDKKTPIRYVFDPDWAPFEWKDEVGKHRGMIADILNIASDNSGITFTPVNVQTWNEAISKVKNKKADMFSGVNPTEEKSTYVNFTKKILYQTPYVFVSRKNDNSDYFETFKALDNKKAAVVENYAIHDILKIKQPNINLLAVTSTMNGFEKVQKGELDIFIVNGATAKYYINSKGFDDLIIASKTNYNLDLKVAIRKDLPNEIISIVDKALNSITQKEISDIYHKWTSIKIEEKIDWTLLYQISGVGFLIIGLMLYHNRKLKFLVEEKTSKLTTLLYSFDENVIASKTDLKGKITYASEAFCKITGYSQKELIGSPQNIIRHQDMPKKVFKDLWKTIKNGNTWKGEIKNRSKNGSFYWVEAVITPEFDSNGKAIGYSAIRQDITSKKEVEELSENLERKVEERTSELKESQEKFLTLFDSAPDSIAIINKEGKYIDCNQKTLDIFGVKNRELFTSTLPSDHSPEFQDEGIRSDELSTKRINDAIKKGYNLFEWKHKRYDTNEVFDAEVILSSIVLGNESHIYAVVRDISERKELEKEIKNIKERLELTISGSGDGLWEIDHTKNTLWWSPQFKHMLGYRDDEIQIEPAQWVEYIFEDDIESSLEAFSKHVESDAVYDVTFRMISKNGDLIWGRSRAKTLRDNNGKVLRTSGSVANITPLKIAEQKIQKSEEFITSILDSQEQIIITTDGEVITTANESFKKFFNVEDVDEFIENTGRCICDTFDVKAPEGYLQIMMDEEQWIDYIISHPAEIHKAIISRNGIDYTFSVTAANLPGSDNLKSAVFTNITALEEAQININEAKIQLELAYDAANLGLWDWFITEDKLITNDNWSTMLGYKPSTFPDTTDKWVNLVHPDDIEQAFALVTEHIEGKTEIYHFPHRMKGANGEWIWIDDFGKVVERDKDGNAKRFIGVHINIDESKRIAESLEESNKHTRDSIEYASLIQHSLIPEKEQINKYFKEYFTIWQPKDTVGGDIYLFEELRNEDECLLMVIDCTGHGVPGAFVTMLVKAIERQVVAKIDNDPNIDVSPAWILQYFNKTMKKLLKQDSVDSISNAGFDGGVFYYNRRENYVKYAGAETPLFYIQDNKLKTIKTNRHSIGYKRSDINYEFDDYRINIDKETYFYISTDGYFDQIGGDKGFSYSKNKFKDLLSENHQLPFIEQQELLLYTIEQYQADADRNDDMTVVGLRLLPSKEKSKEESLKEVVYQI